MRVAIISFGHPDSGLTLAKHLSSKIDLTFLLAVYGNRFQNGILNLDLSAVPYGLITDRDTINTLFPKEIISYIGDSFRLLLLHTPTLKILRDWKRQNLKFCLQAAKYIQDNNFDVVHFNGSCGFQIYFHFFLRNKPKVFTVHDYIPHSGEKSRSHVFVTTIFSKLNHQLILHSKKLRENFIKFYRADPKKVHAIYNGPLDIYRLFKTKEIKEDPFVILFWGRISKYKGITYLIDAAGIIKKEIPNIKIIIAGKGVLGINQERLDSNIFEINNKYIDNETIVNYIQKASIVVLPYTDATQSAVLMTAYAFDKPVVASSVGGIPELVEDEVTGKLVPPKSPQKLAKAIIDLLKNPQKRKTMSENITKKFNGGEFSWDYVSDRIIEVYKKAINKK